MAAAGGQSASRYACATPAAHRRLPPPDLGGPAPRRTEAPPVVAGRPDQGRDGWLSDLLNRTDAGAGQASAPAAARRRPRATIRWSRCRSTSAG